MSQLDNIKNHLLEGNSLTPIDALNLYGCFRLSGRILDLRKQGFDIETQTVYQGKKHYAQYSIPKNK